MQLLVRIVRSTRNYKPRLKHCLQTNYKPNSNLLLDPPSQVTQSYLPRVLTPRESELDAKARAVQEKVDAKLKRAKAKEAAASSEKEASASE